MKGTPSKKGCPSSGQNQNLSVVFLRPNGEIAAVFTAAISILEHRNTIDAIAVCEISETVSAFRSVTSIQLPDFFYPMVADQRLHHLLGAGV